VTPVAEFEPVPLAGSTVSRATLHNADQVAELDLHIGDNIVIRKAGEVIPEVVRVLVELRPKEARRAELPRLCPKCRSKLVREEGESATRCINSSCPAILLASLRHWVSKAALDVDGLGSKVIEQLTAVGLVKSIADLYRLNHTLLASLDRLGEKSATKIIEALEGSKEQPWHRQLYGLGIHHIGEVNAKALARAFPHYEALRQAATEEPESISKLFGVGQEITQTLQQWFSNEANQQLLSELRALGVSLGEGSKFTSTTSMGNTGNTSSLLAGKTFVLTGTLPTLNRRKAQDLIESAGGKVSSSVSRNTTFLLAGEEAGSKLAKAKSLGVEVIDEDILWKILAGE
jgi:DNA ligase (NAD+)